MIAERHLPALAVVLALGCVPTVLHSYIGTTIDDDRSVASLPVRLSGLDGRPTDRSSAWVRKTYGTTDFIERHYGPSLTLFVARSHDAKRLYHHPEHGVGHGDNYERAIVVRKPERADIPIFVLHSASDRYSVYALLYGDKFIEHPMRFQLRNAFALLVRPRALMTLFFVRGKIDGASRTGTSAAEGLLLATIDSFAAQSGPRRHEHIPETPGPTPTR